jgi:hypothetical protein
VLRAFLVFGFLVPRSPPPPPPATLRKRLPLLKEKFHHATK